MITCWWLRRFRGKRAERVDLILTPEAAANFQIAVPQLLNKERAMRIVKWMQKRESKAA